MALRASRLEALGKVLDLERARGYEDTAVVGGLDRFLGQWADAASGEDPSSADARALLRLKEEGLLDRPYAEMDTRQRAVWLGRVMAQVERETGQARGQPTHRVAPPRPRQTAKAAPSRKPQQKRVTLDSPVAALGGVQSRTVSLLNRMGVSTVRDLLRQFPHRHMDFSNVVKVRDLRVGGEYTVSGVVWEANVVNLGGRRSAQAVLGDETGNIRAVWFNQPHLVKSLKPQSRVALSGRVDFFRNALVLENPEYEVVADGRNPVHTGRLVPVYPSTEGLTQRTLRRIVKGAVDRFAGELKDPLPKETLAKQSLMPLAQAVRQFHYPDSWETRDAARRRLAFDEFFLMQLSVLSWRLRHRQDDPARPIQPEAPVVEAFLRSLPFSLTAAQGRVLEEVMADIARPTAMTRLVQGEVGSGKTVIALAALLAAAACGSQGALVAPTEVLAEQHFLTVERLLEGLTPGLHPEDRITVDLDGLPRPVTVGLLIGGQAKRKKTEMHRLLAEGGVDIVIGTHAVIQQEVEFHNLALVVVDEQHRFGVRQRGTIRGKGVNPHMLVMSATPIPRSLALTVYGDLDMSVLDEMPAHRLPVKTRKLSPDERHKAYRFLRKQVEEGRQAFVVCPLIEESEAVEARAAAEEHQRLSREVFPDLRLDLLHGRMSLVEKAGVMDRFRNGETDILVCTPVIEVGIDVPNATAILIEGANRFGLSQLHQLRGRVGRGGEQGYCMLMAENESEEAKQRLEAVEATVNGFEVAEADLKLRGPGDYFGTRQSGLPTLRVASLADQDILQTARRQATDLLERDPELSAWPSLREAIRRYQSEAPGDVS